MRKLHRTTTASELRAKRRPDDQISEITPIKIGLGPAVGTGSASKPGGGGGGGGGGGFKKGGFKKAFAADSTAPVGADPAGQEAVREGSAKIEEGNGDIGKARPTQTDVDMDGDPTSGLDDGFDSDEVGYEYYDPGRPTGCTGDCAGLNLGPSRGVPEVGLHS